MRGRTRVALPDHCTLRAPVTEARLARSSRFVAEPRSLGLLVIADSDEDPPVLTGVAALTLSASGQTTDPKPIPWLAAASLPRLARAADGSWLAAIERQTEGSSARVDFWRSGALTPIGEGDHFEAADLECNEKRCVLLTSRLGRVAAAGAEVRIGSPGDSISSWTRIDIVPVAGDSDARPVAIAQVDATSIGAGYPSSSPPAGKPAAGVVAALSDKGSCAFWLADAPEGPREIARLPAPHGVLDVLVTPEPIAMTYGNAVDEGGCVAQPAFEGSQQEALDGTAEEVEVENGTQEGSGEGPGGGTGSATLRFERAGLPGVEVRAPAPPLTGALRRLAQGSLAVWIAPLGCKISRKVVYAVVVDTKGAPTSEVMPIADADRFAVASSGASVDLWLEREEALTWIPLSCSAPPR